MQVRSRRKAREAALRILYEVEFGHVGLGDAMAQTFSEASLPAELEEFAAMLVSGVLAERAELDPRLSALILDYAFDRVAAIDRNVMRIAAYELLFLPSIPPAVTLNEAVEIAKKYSTAESGKFVNGVLGKFLLTTPKADWNPDDAPLEIEATADVETTEVEEVEVTEDEAEKIARVGGWTIRAGEST